MGWREAWARDLTQEQRRNLRSRGVEVPEPEPGPETLEAEPLPDVDDLDVLLAPGPGFPRGGRALLRLNEGEELLLPGPEDLDTCRCTLPLEIHLLRLQLST